MSDTEDNFWLTAWKKSDTRTRRNLVKQVGNAPAGEQSFARLGYALSDADWSVRRAAVKALGKVGTQDTIPILLPVLRDRRSEVRQAAFRALYKTGGDNVIGIFCERLDDKKVRVRQDAAAFLCAVGMPAVAPLCRLIQNRRSEGGSQTSVSAAGVLRRLVEMHRETLPLHILTAPGLSASERWIGLETVRGFGRVFLLGVPVAEVRRYCERVLRGENAEAKTGANAVLEYMTLARPSERRPDEQREMLLRPASGNVVETPPETLLRASDRDDETDEPPPTLLTRFLNFVRGN